jgi:pimeloyl-ACP methyl ester carboxylesterase
MPGLRASPRTFVLVHGASHGGWCYDRVADRLRALGHRVFTPTLAGLAERSGEDARQINLTTHVNDILRLFDQEGLRDVVLCGHSYGGMVISGVADQIPERIDNLVFLDAVVPDNGTCMADYIFPGWRGVMLKVMVALLGGGSRVIAPPASFFKVNKADRKMVDRMMTSHPYPSLRENIRIGNNADRIAGHTYIYATEWGFPAITDQFERAKKRIGWRVFEVKSGHDIMIDAPDELSEILNDLD